MKIGFKPNPDNKTTHLTWEDEKGIVDCHITGQVLLTKDLMAFKTVNGGLFVVYTRDEEC